MVKSLRESELKQILDTIETVANSFDGSKNRRSAKNSLNVSSISRASKDLIMSFPVLCDNSLDPKTAAMICKAVERKAVTMLQLLFASCSFNGTNGREILQQWHSNIDIGSLTMDDYLDLMDRVSESYKLTTSDKRAINEAVQNMKIEMRNHDKVYPTSNFSERSINEYTVYNRHGETVIMEDKINDDQPAYYILDPKVDVYTAHKMKLEKDKSDRDKVASDLKNQYTKAQIDDLRRRGLERKANDVRMQQQINADQVSMIHRTLMDNDVKKCNELVPSLMIVNFVAKNEEGTKFTHPFVAGVKARLIAVDAFEIVDRVQSKNKDRKGLLNLVKATTKEIAFIKDYLLAIDKAKINAKNNSKRNGHSSSRIWNTLEKRATKSVYKRLRGKVNDAGAITTLVVSQQVVNLLKKEYNVNLADVRTASIIMDSYNLLALVIVDESMEVARFLYDGDTSFEDLSFNSLERESGDGSYKKVINLLSKMNK